MAHTFSSLSPKQQTSAQVESKNPLVVNSRNNNDSLINPFSIAARRDSETNSEGEHTAEGFFKGQDQTEKRDEINLSSTSYSSSLIQPPALLFNDKPLPSQYHQHMSPFDVVLQEQQRNQITRKIGAQKVQPAQTSEGMSRHSNPLGQIQKLQIVSLN